MSASKPTPIALRQELNALSDALARTASAKPPPAAMPGAATEASDTSDTPLSVGTSHPASRGQGTP